MDFEMPKRRYMSIMGTLEDFEFNYMIPSMISYLSEITQVAGHCIKTQEENLIRHFFDKSIYSELGLPAKYGAYVKDDIYLHYKPSSFDDLVRIEGLAHGAGTWYSNAKSVFADKKCEFDKLISVKEDISAYLHYAGMKIDDASAVEEDVSSGRVSMGASDRWDRLREKMMIHGIPHWYIWSCTNILRLYTKAEMTERVNNQLKLAFYKDRYPEIYDRVLKSHQIENFLK